MRKDVYRRMLTQIADIADVCKITWCGREVRWVIVKNDRVSFEIYDHKEQEMVCMDDDDFAAIRLKAEFMDELIFHPKVDMYTYKQLEYEGKLLYKATV